MLQFKTVSAFGEIEYFSSKVLIFYYTQNLLIKLVFCDWKRIQAFEIHFPEPQIIEELRITICSVYIFVL